MKYFVLEVELHDADKLHDLIGPIEIFNSFVEALGNDVIGSNFNKYYNPNLAYDRPRIAVRANVNDEVKAKEVILGVAHDLKKSSKIRDYKEELTIWAEPTFVIEAHELGTKCVVELKNCLSKNPKLSNIFEQKKGNFLFQFACMLLEQLKFQPFITWDIRRNFPVKGQGLESELKQIVGACAETCKLQKPCFKSADFLQRFTHAFFNCAGQEGESIFINAVLFSLPYKLIFDSTLE